MATRFWFMGLLVAITACSKASEPRGPAYTDALESQIKAFSADCRILDVKPHGKVKQEIACTAKGRGASIELDEGRKLMSLQVLTVTTNATEAKASLATVLSGIAAPEALAFVDAHVDEEAKSPTDRGTPTKVGGVDLIALRHSFPNGEAQFSVTLRWARY